jgi:hypothetical protein
MSHGKKTALPLAAAALEFMEAGHTAPQVADMLKLTVETVTNIFHGRHGWDRLHNDPEFLKYRQVAKRQMQAATSEIAKSALLQIARKLPQASAASATYVYGILRDKERLDAGEATQHIAIVTRHEIANLDKLAEILAQSLLESKTDLPQDES